MNGDENHSSLPILGNEWFEWFSVRRKKPFTENHSEPVKLFTAKLGGLE